MTAQMDLFSQAGRLLFVRGSDTSAAAALSIDAPTLREQVLAAIRLRGEHGATCDELEQMLQMRHQTLSARVRELAKAEWIVDSGRRRPTRANRAATVWVAA